MEKPNLNYIHQLSGGDKEFEKEITTVIKEEFAAELEVYKMNFKSKNYAHLVDNVHKLKHKISILGLEKSYAVAINYENNLRDGSIELSSEFEEILASMTDFINNF